MIKNHSIDADMVRHVEQIRSEIQTAAVRAGRDPRSVRLMAVTKTVPAETVNRAIDAGVALLGENRAQELLEKYEHYAPAEIHFIGHLQTNKVRSVIDKVSMIESVDSLRLAQEIDRQAGKLGRTMDILLQVNVGREASKSGFFAEELTEALQAVSGLAHVRVKGLMAIPPKCDNDKQSGKFFCTMNKIFLDIRDKKLDNICMDELSMGMSADYIPAIENGATIVRLGTALFGKRSIPNPPAE